MKFKFEKELRVGQVTEVRGKKVICRIFENKNGPFVFINGEIIKNVTIGSYVVIPVGYNLIVGKIEGEYAVEKPNNSELYNEIELITRKVEISILGTYDNDKFTLGISYMPLINSDLYIAPKYLLDNLFVFSSENVEDDGGAITIGTDIDNNLPVTVSVEKLFANHIGIFGNTGSGKSNTLAYLYTKLFEKYDFDYHNQFVFLDFSNEYSSSLTKNKTVVHLSNEGIEKLYLPIATVFNIEFLGNLLDVAEKIHRPFIKDVISVFNKCETKSIDKIKKQLGEVLEQNPNIEAKSKTSIDRFLGTAENNEFDVFYGFSLFIAFKEHAKDKLKLDSNLWGLINRVEQQCNNLKKFIKFQSRNTDYKDIIIIDLNLLSLENKLIISYLIASRYYNKFLNRTSDNNTFNLIIDEAHKILACPSAGESNNFKEFVLNRFEEYIKEGRKFGFYLTIASQRPSDISSMFLSQMHNYFIHRLVNQNDIDNLSNAISFLDEKSFQMISSLKVGTCIYSGLAANFPIIVNIPKLDEDIAPKSKNISITANAKLKIENK